MVKGVFLMYIIAYTQQGYQNTHWEHGANLNKLHFNSVKLWS